MLDQKTTMSPLVLALIQDMAKPPNYGGSSGGLGALGGIPLESLMKMFSQGNQTPEIGAPQQAPAPLSVG